ncbi:MAG: hypothetical protein K6G23_06340 [Lachnospiraceae bacterium]|nr:hypothetical protein [Lachnospiraceae bacterium]
MKKRHYTIAIMIMLPILVFELMAGYLLIRNGALQNFNFNFSLFGDSDGSVIDQMKQEVVKEAVEQAIATELGEDVDIDELQEQMSEDDAKQVDELLEKYSDSSYIQTVVETVTEKGQSLEESVETLKGTVDSEDLEALKELYEKYGSSILDTVTN